MTSYADNFNRTEAPLASGWSTSSGYSGMRADGSVCRGNGNIDNGSYYSGATPGNDHYNSCTFPNGLVNGADGGPGVRHNTGGTATFYLLDHSGTAVDIKEVTGGSQASLASQTDTLSTTAVYKLDVTGTTLTATKDGGNFTGGSLTAIDSSITSGTWCFYMWANYLESANHLDMDSGAGDDGAGGATYSPPFSIRFPKALLAR